MVLEFTYGFGYEYLDTGIYVWFWNLRMVLDMNTWIPEFTYGFGIYVWFWNLRMVLDMNTWIPVENGNLRMVFEFTYGFGIYVWFWNLRMVLDMNTWIYLQWQADSRATIHTANEQIRLSIICVLSRQAYRSDFNGK